MSARVKVHRDLVRHRGRVITLVGRELSIDGRRRTYDIVTHPGAVAIVPMVDARTVALVHQYRVSIKKSLYEIVAGTLEAGERPDRAARRELVEEVGLAGGRLVRLARFYTAPGFCTEWMHLYLATGLREVKSNPEPDEVLRRVDMPLRDALKMIHDGRIRDAKSIVGILLAAERV